MGYSMVPVQMRFLRLLSRRVSQNITYLCYNSRAWDDDGGRTIKLQGVNEMELTGNDRTKPVVLKNGCKVKTNNTYNILERIFEKSHLFGFRLSSSSFLYSPYEIKMLVVLSRAWNKGKLWMTEKLYDWPNDWANDWLTDLLTDVFIDWINLWTF